MVTEKGTLRALTVSSGVGSNPRSGVIETGVDTGAA